MNIELVQQIVDYIKKLAEPLVTAGYTLVLKQVQYIMIRDIVFTVLLIGVLITLIVLFKKAIKWCDGDGDGIGAIIGLSLFLFVPTIITIVANISSILNTLINPDWVAIQMIMSLVK
jgi:hypothetical protein